MQKLCIQFCKKYDANTEYTSSVRKRFSLFLHPAHFSNERIESYHFPSFHFFPLHRFVFPLHRCICFQLQSATYALLLCTHSTCTMCEYIIVLPYRMYTLCAQFFQVFALFSFWSRLLFCSCSCSCSLSCWMQRRHIKFTSMILVPSNIIAKLKAKINGS